MIALCKNRSYVSRENITQAAASVKRDDAMEIRGSRFIGLLAIAFIILKLCGVIGWSWLWVLAPVWIPIGLFIVISFGMYLYKY